MKIALFSPLNPIKTGIADYTEELLPELGKHFDIDLYIDRSYEPDNPDIRQGFSIFPYDPSRFDPDHYDAILYHMGNNYEAHAYLYDALIKFPGIVVLHDYVLQGFYAERYETTKNYDEYRDLLVRYYHEKGEAIAENIIRPKTLPIWESAEAFDLPLNEEVLEAAKALIVHSDFIKNKVWEKIKRPVIRINHHGHVIKTFDRQKLRKSMGIGEKDILISSTGYINKNKRIGVILEALEELSHADLVYIIAGEDKGNLLKNYLENRRLKVVVKGHLPIEDLEAMIHASDICINLRFPTMGESSGSLLRMLGYGLPVLVTNYGSYADFPDFCLLKVDPDIDEKELIKRFIQALIEDEEFRRSLGSEASRYVQEECSLQKCASEYAAFIKEQGGR